MRLFRGELRKLLLRPATRTILGLFALGLIVIYAAVGVAAGAMPEGTSSGDLAPLLTFPAAYHGLLAFFPLFGGIGLAIYAGLVIGSEWSWGTLRLAFIRGEGRTRYVLTTFAAIAVLALGGLVLLFGLGVGVAVVAGRLSGFPIGNLADPATLASLPRGLALAWLGMLLIASIAFATNAIVRSQVAGLGLVVALVFGEQFAAIVAPPELLRFAPISAASGLPATDGLALLPVLVAVVYVVAALALTSVAIERSEIA